MLGLEPDEYEEELRSGRASMTPEERAEAAAMERGAERAAARSRAALGAFRRGRVGGRGTRPRALRAGFRGVAEA